MTLNGEYDHVVTPLILQELGQLAIESGDYDAATKYLEEASYSAYAFGDLTVMEEAFRYGQQAHLLSGAHGVFPPLAAAIQWASKRTYAHELTASLCLSLAEGFALQGQNPQAVKALTEAQAMIANRDMGQHQIGAG